jgi:hypothetical protein
MIYGTRYSPGKAFIEFARDFFEAIARSDFQSALGQLDARERRWSKKALMAELQRVIGKNSLCSAVDFAQSANPELIALENGSYQLVHRLPVAGKWSNAVARFEFVAKSHGNQFSVFLIGFEP